MVGVYASLCEKGVKNINDVPANLVKKVKAKVIADGYYIDEEGWCHKAEVGTEEETAEDEQA